MKNKRCVVLCAHDDYWFVGKAIEAAKSFGPVYVFVSRRAWNGPAGDFERVAEEAKTAGSEVVYGDWDNEADHRRAAYQAVLEQGFEYALIPDGDEVIEPGLLQTLADIAKTGIAERIHAHMDTYWKSARYVIRPREQLAPAILIKLGIVKHVYIRDFEGGRGLVLGPEHGVIHHLSYAGPDERIQRKISTWSHRHELVQDWYRNVWLGWDREPTMRDLHPTHPQAYGMAERIHIPKVLEGVWDDRKVADPSPPRPKTWPKVSVIIPLHGGEEDFRLCLESLSKCQDLLHETIVVDDASPDDAAKVAEGFNVTLIRNEENLGFGRTCNRGFENSTGDIVFFLNSDTIVPRAGLIRLIEELMESGSIGATGPMSNNVGYHQMISPTYTSLSTLDLFAADLAESGKVGRDVEILVGFALAVRRSVLNEVGLFDERFGPGLFEDTDLCYRILRAGYRLRMVASAYVHHWGSRTITRVIPDVTKLLDTNGKLYKQKWAQDIESGYASYLPGFALKSELVHFNDERRPDRVLKSLEKLKEQAKISLCMIVKNEERVLAQCLESALPYFFEIIVVDTGSTDRTKEIAREFGVKLIESTWPDSFSVARNESLSHATGDWVFWMDADDVLPLSSGEAVLHAAINAPEDINGFIVPVQFVEDGPDAGTRVDHVKLFRNFEGIHFVGRIHEQILESINEQGGEIARLNAIVLHAGYDTSAVGQARKRERDWHLLNLDLQDRPEHPFVWFNIGMTHHYTGGHIEAIEALRQCLEYSGPTDSTLRKTYAMLGVSQRILGDLAGAEQTFRDGLARVGEDPELAYQLAMTLTDQGRYLEAKHLYENLPTDTGRFFTSIDRGILTFKRLHNLGGVKYTLGDYAAAKADWIEAFRQNPHTAISLIALFDAAIEKQDLHVAKQAIEDIGRIEGLSLNWAERRSKLADVLQEPGGSFGAMMHFHQSSPAALGPRIMLMRHFLGRDQVHNAIAHMEYLQAHGVAEAAFFLSVTAIQAGDLDKALMWTEKAAELNPGHAQTLEQLEKLRGAVSTLPESILGPEEQVRLLTGPHAGSLGEATMRHSVVVVTYNSEHWIKACLESVYVAMGPNDEIIVVDNASSDSTASVVDEVAEGLDIKCIRLINSEDNIGYARGANVGILASKGAYITILNPDTTVESTFLRDLSAHLGEGVGVVGPVSDNIGGAQFVGHYVQPGVPISALDAVMKESHAGKGLDTKLIMGMCMMVSREVFNKVGLFDENLYLGADDLEFSWRLRCLGLKLVVALDCFVHHAGGKSFETKPRNEVSELVSLSDLALIRKLRAYYGETVPSSHALFGCDILQEALQKWSLI